MPTLPKKVKLILCFSCFDKIYKLVWGKGRKKQLHSKKKTYLCRNKPMDKIPVNISPNLIKHYADYLRLELSLSDNSVEAYCHDVNLFLQYLEVEKISADINTITQKTIDNFFAYLFDLNIGATSQARILSGLKSFWRYLTQENLTETGNPEDDRQHRPQPTHWPPQQSHD